MDEFKIGAHEPLQVNIGQGQRVAGRDYYEYFVPGSLKMFLATQPMEKRYSLTLNNPEMFRYRFGFEPVKAVRQKVLDIQKQHEFSDHDIRWLNYSGHLRISHGEVKLAPSKLMPAIGWLQMALLSAVSLAMFVEIILSHAPAGGQMLGILFVFGLLSTGTWLLRSYYIAPWEALKRSGLTAKPKAELP